MTDKVDKMGLAYTLAEKMLANNPQRSNEYAGAAYRLANELNDTRMKAQAAYLGAQASLKLDRIEDARTRLNRAADAAVQIRDFTIAEKCYNALEDMALKSGDTQEAYNLAKKQVAMYKAMPGAKPAAPAPAVQNPTDDSGPKIKTLQSDNEVLRNRIQELESEIRRLSGDRENLSKSSKELSERSAILAREREEALKAIDEGRSKLSEAEKERLASIERDKRKQKLLEALKNSRVLDSIVYAQELQQKQLELTEYSLLSERSANQRNLLLLAVGVVGLLAFGIFRRFRETRLHAKTLEQKNEIIKQEQERSDELLLNILPAEIAAELKQHGKARPRHYNNVTVLFTDFKNFTHIAENLSPDELVAELDHCFKAFDYIAKQHKVEKIKTIGDAYMCATGFVENNPLPPLNIIQAALDIQEFLQEYKEERLLQGKPYFEARIGIHSGPVVAGVVGVNKFAFDIWGDTVNIAARMEQNSEPGRINISETTYFQIKYQYQCRHRGRIAVKNKGDIDMYYVESKLQPV